MTRVYGRRIQTSLRRIGFWLPLAICSWMALGAEPSQNLNRVGDVPLHLFAFVYLSAALSIAHLRDRWRLVVVAMVAYGGAIEFIQYFLPNRDAQLKDFVVDLVGIAIGLVAYRLFGEALWNLCVTRVVDRFTVYRST